MTTLGTPLTPHATRVLLLGSGEYTIETWIIPDSLDQGANDNNPARILSYSGSTDERNFTLGQYDYNYVGMNRTGESDANGEPVLATNDNDERAQASLQHVVLSFDPIRGRRLYVNGEFTGDTDATAGAFLKDWDNGHALVVGNEVSGNRPWAGSLRFLAIHKRAMSEGDIKTNFDVGVGARYLLLFNVSDDMLVMQREIFGPLLPVKSYHDASEVIAYINSKPRPLAFYPFTQDKALQQRYLAEVMSGGVTINHAILHVGQHDLPFGGIGESGMGHYHGYEGFLTFSKLRPVFKQGAYNSVSMLLPPYGKLAEKMTDWLIKLKG